VLQAVQHQNSGELVVKELPAPELRPKMILVRVAASLISAGTERTSVAGAQASLVGRARANPDQVRLVWEMMKKEGVRGTLEKVRGKLDSYKSLGYSAAGTVIASSCDEFAPGDRVACGGQGIASHAEVIAVPRNLAVKIPEGVEFDEAAFTTLGAIAMQGVRQARVSLGESVAVVGLGLLGQLTVQLLKSSGCRVVGLDINDGALELARSFGADLAVKSGSAALGAVESFTRGVGCDAVILTAGTSSNEPMEFAIKAARKRGRVVVVGGVGMDLPRSPFYEKELDITISCSYGPGRYDPQYEEEGIDYPVGFVRWTERRNMESVLDLVAARRLDVARMITHRFPITEAPRAYDIVTGKVHEASLGIILTYPDRPDSNARTIQVPTAAPKRKETLGIGFVGAGNFAQGTLLPPLRSLPVSFRSVMTSTPVNARSVAERFGFAEATSDVESMLSSSDVDALFIASRHDSHARYVLAGLHAGRQVFVEKPLAVTREELAQIDEAAATNNRVMVGFNRRFSAPVVAMREHLAPVVEPLVMLYRVNAGFVPPEAWVQNDAQGGRIIGEGCHFIDTMSYLCGSLPVSVHATAVGSANVRALNADNVAVTLRFANGAIGTLLYLAGGDPSIPKEYFEAHGGGRSAIMDNFRTLVLASGKRSNARRFGGDKGHAEEMKLTVEAMRSGGAMPITYASLRATTIATFGAMESLETGLPVAIG